MNRKFEITDAKRGAAFTVRVIMRAQRNEIAAIQEDGTIKIRLTALAQDAESNQQLIEFLAGRLGVEPKVVEIVAGKDGRDKMISVEGISTRDVETRLQPDPGAASDE